MVRHANDDQFEILALDDGGDIGSRFSNVPFARETLRMIEGGRCHDGDLPVRHIPQPLQVEVADESAAHKTNSNRHGESFNRSQSRRPISLMRASGHFSSGV